MILETTLAGARKTKASWAGNEVPETPEEHQVEVRLWLHLLACSSLVEAEIRRRLRDKFDFTLARFDLLAQLDKAKAGMILGDVSKSMMVSAGNVTSLVERLLESGHISRTTSSADRRVQIINLTAFGRLEFKKMALEHGKWIGEIFTGVSPRDSALLIKELSKMKTTLRRSLAKPSGGGA